MSKEQNKKSPSELLMDDIEPIYCMIDEGGPVHPTQYDESDDLEAAKKVIEKMKTKELFIKEILKDQKLAANLNKIAIAKSE